MKESVIRRKSKDMALKIISQYKYLVEDKKEYVLSKQLLRSGTSIGANVVEASNAQSDNDFIAKLYIALKEAGETQYWLELLYESEYLDIDKFNSVYEDCTEVIKILTAIIVSKKSNMINSVKN
jgi:four helix bundle protein